MKRRSENPIRTLSRANHRRPLRSYWLSLGDVALSSMPTCGVTGIIVRGMAETGSMQPNAQLAVERTRMAMMRNDHFKRLARPGGARESTLQRGPRLA
jgi:hypothetical protein